MKTIKVIFLIEKDENELSIKRQGDVFAYFPDNWYNLDNLLRESYAHVGQHSACHIDYANECKEATEEQSEDLKKELESIGYKLEVISKYELQAINFLNATETEFTIPTNTTIKHDFYFPDDKETRDIYTIILKNKQHRYRFTFGQSIANTGQHPTAYDVLSCLQKYDCGDFENFCSDFGYDTDSRKAYKVYKAVKREWENVKRLWTPEQIELLQEIQ